jgi:hypothetical protein
MKHHLSSLDYALWLTIMGLQFAVWIFALSNRLQTLHPRFVSYLVFLCAKSTLLIVLSLCHPYSWYFWAFYSCIAVETTLLMLVVYEIFRNTFDPLGALPPGTIARLVAFLTGATAILISVACWRPAPTSLFVDTLTAILRTVHHTVAFAATLALFSLVMYARSLAIPWRSRTAGIAAGFLFLLSFESFVRAGQSFAPHAWFAWFDRALSLVTAATLATWIQATRRPEEILTNLPTPEALQKTSKAVAEMRSTLDAARVKVESKWSVE